MGPSVFTNAWGIFLIVLIAVIGCALVAYSGVQLIRRHGQGPHAGGPRSAAT